jgi:peptide/nickel transport system permease protein
MLSYLAKRLMYMVLILWILSIVSFIIIQLPPGDFVTTLINRMISQGRGPSDRTAYEARLRAQYGLDRPMIQQYLLWIRKMFQGDLGLSFGWMKPVKELISERMGITLAIAVLTLIFIYAVGIPIGIYSATHQYSAGDYTFTVIGFIGMAIPEFLSALVLLTFFYLAFGLSIGSLFSTQFENAPWSLARFVDMLKHLPVPIIVGGLAGTAGIIRIMRGCLLDELRKQYVITARAKGLQERKLLFKYPVRVALNPIVSTLGWDIPWVISTQTIVGIVLNLPTLGPLLLQALLLQDVYLAGAIILLLCAMTVVGTFVSDILLAWIDPRIRFERGQAGA